MSDVKRMDWDERKELILAAAMEVAAEKGSVLSVTRVAVAKKGGFTEGLINRYFGSLLGLHAAIREEAKAQGVTFDAPVG